MPSRLNLSERVVLLRTIDAVVLYLGILSYNHCLGFTYINLIAKPVGIDILVFLTYFLTIGQVLELYKLRDSASRFKTTKNLFVTTGLSILLYLYTPIITPVLPENRIEILVFLLTVFFSVFIWRNIYIWTIARQHFYKPILLICSDKEKLQDLISFINTDARDHKVVGYVADEKLIEDYTYFNTKDINLNEVVTSNKIQQFVVGLDGFSEDSLVFLNERLADYFEKGVHITSFTDYLERIMFCVPQQNLDNHFYKYFNFSENHENKLYLFVLRVLDVFVGIIGLFFLLLVLPFVLIGNLIGNRGPLFYKQERVGQKGKNFDILKLRSMVTNAEKNGAQWAQKQDARITKFGKFLRKSRLDEIPQFLNILKGEMSLIGPRPERPQFVAELKDKFPLYPIRHVIKPGLTGWAQVMYPYAATLEEQEKKMRYDLYYIKERGFYMDFKIIIKTIHTVLYMKGQ